MDKPALHDQMSPRARNLAEIENQCQAVEEALRESEEKYESLLDLSPDSVVIFVLDRKSVAEDARYKLIMIPD